MHRASRIVPASTAARYMKRFPPGALAVMDFDVTTLKEGEGIPVDIVQLPHGKPQMCRFQLPDKSARRRQPKKRSGKGVSSRRSESSKPAGKSKKRRKMQSPATPSDGCNRRWRRSAADTAPKQLKHAMTLQRARFRDEEEACVVRHPGSHDGKAPIYGHPYV